MKDEISKEIQIYLSDSTCQALLLIKSDLEDFYDFEYNKDDIYTDIEINENPMNCEAYISGTPAAIESFARDCEMFRSENHTTLKSDQAVYTLRQLVNMSKPAKQWTPDFIVNIQDFGGITHYRHFCTDNNIPFNNVKIGGCSYHGVNGDKSIGFDDPKKISTSFYYIPVFQNSGELLEYIEEERKEKNAKTAKQWTPDFIMNIGGNLNAYKEFCEDNNIQFTNSKIGGYTYHGVSGNSAVAFEDSVKLSSSLSRLREFYLYSELYDYIVSERKKHKAKTPKTEKDAYQIPDFALNVHSKEVADHLYELHKTYGIPWEYGDVVASKHIWVGYSHGCWFRELNFDPQYAQKIIRTKEELTELFKSIKNPKHNEKSIIQTEVSSNRNRENKGKPRLFSKEKCDIVRKRLERNPIAYHGVGSLIRSTKIQGRPRC